MKGAKFELGRVVATKGIAELMDSDAEFQKFCSICLQRHAHGDWGIMVSADAERNNRALQSGEERIHSAYTYPKADEHIWIITEYDRSATTILFPSEY